MFVFYVENIAKSGSPQAEEPDKSIPVIPPRPSPQLILERCTENTCKRVSIHEADWKDSTAHVNTRKCANNVNRHSDTCIYK